MCVRVLERKKGEPIRHVGKLLMTKLFSYLHVHLLNLSRDVGNTVLMSLLLLLLPLRLLHHFFFARKCTSISHCVLYTLSAHLTSNFLGVLLLFGFALVK